MEAFVAERIEHVIAPHWYGERLDLPKDETERYAAVYVKLLRLDERIRTAFIQAGGKSQVSLPGRERFTIPDDVSVTSFLGKLPRDYAPPWRFKELDAPRIALDTSGVKIDVAPDLLRDWTEARTQVKDLAPRMLAHLRAALERGAIDPRNPYASQFLPDQLAELAKRKQKAPPPRRAFEPQAYPWDYRRRDPRCPPLTYV